MTDNPKTDAEKHAWMRRRGYPSAVFLPPSIYDAAVRAGYVDMRPFVKTKPIPAARTRKSPGKYCGGLTCMPGKNGKCVACADEE